MFELKGLGVVWSRVGLWHHGLLLDGE